jgi:5-dehydro-4-deoxyglucarate dehydratase
VNLSPRDVKQSLSGVVAFALTPFSDDGSVNSGALKEEIERLIHYGCSGLFPAGFTGEFFSLTPAEYFEVVSTCTATVAGRIPVVAGVGYGTGIARSFAEAAEEAGADGILVLPPYLTEASQEGLADHYLAVADAVKIGVVLYQRDSVLFEPSTVRLITNASNVIGFKDGAGQIERLLRIRRAVGDSVVYLNGMPTAEIHVQALASCGVRAYSSAAMTFMPEVAVKFAKAFEARDHAVMEELLNSAILPFAEIRNRGRGYAVSLVKAAARFRGARVGSVRPPLRDPVEKDEQDVRELLCSLGLEAELSSPLAAS